MTKVLRCRDVGIACDYVACGSTVEDVLRQGAEHARIVHDKTSFSPEEEQKVRSLIRDEERCPSK
jgi:predicted small metal-binding protein